MQERIDGHVAGLHGFRTGSTGSKFDDMSNDDIMNLVYDGVRGPVAEWDEDGIGHFHEWDTGRTIGTVNGQRTSRMGVRINRGPDGGWLLGTVFPIR